MKSETVMLGEREFVLKELPLRKARAFRETLKTHFGAFIAVFEGAPQTDITNTRSVAGLMRGLSDTLLNSVDLAADLLYEYSPDIATQRDYIEDHATSSEVVDAFLALMSLAFPFFGTSRGQRLMSTIQKIGSNDSQTLTSSPSLSGESGQTSLTR
jgi:hypothetical protein